MARRLEGLTPAEVLESPYILAGSAEEIAAQLRGHRERWGFRYLSAFWQNVPAMAEVMPLLR